MKVVTPTTPTSTSAAASRDEPDPFGRFADAEAMRRAFQEHSQALFGANLAVTECRILDSRLKTYLKERSRDKATFSACYRLGLERPVRDDGLPAILYAKAYLGGRSAAEYGRLAVGTAPEAIHIAELDMIVWRFPNDPALPQLPEVILPQRAIRHLPYGRLGADMEGADLSVEVVNYRPEQRCTARYRLSWGAPAARNSLVLYGKTFAGDQGEEIAQRVNMVWHDPGFAAEGLRVPEPLAYDDATRTLWLRGVDGAPLRESIGPENSGRVLDTVARGLLALHRSSLPTATTVTRNDLLADMLKKAAKLSRSFPHLAADLESVAGQLQSAAATMPAPLQRPIYADFHIGQLLARGEDIYFLDFDEISLGEPAQDVANFAVDLIFQGFDPDFALDAGARLLAAYRAHAPWEVAEESVCWHALIQLINKAYRFHLQQRPTLRQDLELALSRIALFRDRMDRTRRGGDR